MPAITPFLWFDDEAEEAARFYTSVFPNSQILEVSGSGGDGPPTTVRFSLDGTEFVALNGGPAHRGFNLAVSFVVDCAGPDEVDRYWSALTDGGEEGRCGWLTDRFGLSWQIVPVGLGDLLGDPDAERAAHAMEAMLAMGKLDLPAIARAADGAA